MIKISIKKRIVLSLITVLFFSRAAMALNFAVDVTGAPFCVDHSGSGGNFTTLIAAITAANVAGGPHTIDICPGAYTAQAGALAAANYVGLTIQGTTGIAANVTVNPTGGNEIFDIRQPNITIQHLTAISGNGNDGIEIRGNNASVLNVDIQNTGRNGILVFTSTGVTISNVTITTTVREGILANAGSTGLVINSADGTKPATVITGTTRECIEVDAPGVNIDDVTVSNCNNMGVRIDGANATLDNIVVNTTNNIGIFLNGLAPLLNQDNTVTNTITISNTAREGVRSTNNADNAIIDNLTINTTGANFECVEHQGDGDGVTVNFQNYNLSNCGREGLWMRSPNQVADTIKVDTNGSGRECMEVDGADSIVTNLDLDNCAGIGLRIDGARVSATTVDINTTGNIGLRFDGANVTVTTATIANTNSYGLLVSGNDGTVDGINISNANNTGMRIENARADIDNIDITNTRIHGLQITQNDADINTLALTNIGTYLAGNGGADGITTSNRRVNLTNVTINDARDFGIHYNTTNNNFTGAVNFTNITVKDTGDDGMFINRSTNNLIMDTINITNSTQDGMRLNRSDRATLSNLNLNNNTLDGLVLFRTRRITISDSTVDTNQDGVVFERSRQNEIFDSTISNNTNRGIMLLTNNNNTTDEARNNLIHDNNISGNANFGLRIFNNATADNDNNQIYENCFNNPAGINARDDETIGTPAANRFDVGARGNFWDDDSANVPGFSESCVDVALPIGICDTTFPIPNAGNSVDNNPLTTCGVLPPVDHYDIDFSTATGITCEPISVTITAKDATNNTAVHTALSTIDLSTNTLLGTWVSRTAGTGIFTPGATGTGLADYQFPIGENTVTLVFSYTALATPPVDSVNINITSSPNETSGTAPGDTDPGDGTDDPSIDFRDAIFRIVDSAATPINITAKLAGRPSDTAATGFFQDLYLQAIETVTATECTGTFESQNDVIVELAAECNNPIMCASVQVQIDDDSGTPVSIPGNTNASVTTYSPTAGAGSVQLDFDTDSKTPLHFVYSDAGQISLHARYDIDPPNLSYVSGSSNAFVVKPFGFDIDNAAQRASDWLQSPTGLNGTRVGPVDDTSWAQTASDSIFVDAGENFNITVRAVVWQSGDDTSPVDGVPDIGVNLTDNALTPNFGDESATELVDVTHSKVEPTGAGTVNGTLTGGDNLDFTGTGGTLTTAISWDEVGIIDLIATLDSTIDSEYLAGGSGVTTTHEDFGRFTPYAFEATTNIPIFGPACGSFSYIGQSFTYTTSPIISLTAKAKGIAPAFGNTTQNYTGAFFKLTDTKLVVDGNRTYSAAVGALDLGNVLVPVPLAVDPTIVNTGSGTATLTFSDGGGIAFTRGNPENPFDADIALSLDVLDEDDIFAGNGSGVNQNPVNFGTASAGIGIDFTGANKEQRWGRLVLDNAFGSELLPVEQPLRTEYQSSGNFITNADDSCTPYTSASISFSNHNGITAGANLTAAGTGSLMNGVDDTANPVILSNSLLETGSVDITYALGLPLYWLQYDWDSDTNHDNDPFSRATWGIFSGPDEFIYIRERW